jgi:hypothetical protein
MAFPGNPSKGPAGFGTAPLTPEDFERLATAFRPSWELDEAPFTGAGVLSPADIQALQGGGTLAAVRATAGSLGSNGSHPPPKATVPLDAPTDKVIVDVTSAPPPTVQVVPERPRVVASAGPWAAASGAEFTVPAAPMPQSKVITVRPPAPRPSLPSDAAFPKPASKTGLWAAVGGAAVLVVGGIIWLGSSGSESANKAAPLPAPTQKVPDRTASIPPPPPEPVAAAVPVQAAAAPAPAAPPSPPVVAATSLPPAPLAANPPPTPRAVVMNAPAPHPVSSPPPAPKAPTASRPKATIVRDVPF